jgi:hypothetical protein
MAGDKQEMSSTLVFGISGTTIALVALLVAFMQLRKMRRMHHVYELA